MPKKKVINKNEQQVKFAVIIMAVLIVAFLASYFGFRMLLDSMHKFEYKNIEFRSDSIGYWAIIPITDMYGNVADSVKVRFWEDPRKLERIKIEDKISLTKATAVDLETLFEQGDCMDAKQAGQTILLYLSNANLFGISPLQVLSEKKLAERLNLSYFDCTNSSKLTGIVLKKGSESKITKQGSCYILEAGNGCEIMNVTERFMLQAFNDARV